MLTDEMEYIGNLNIVQPLHQVAAGSFNATESRGWIMRRKMRTLAQQLTGDRTSTGGTEKTRGNGPVSRAATPDPRGQRVAYVA
ncbi:MAG: hypothetical protein IPL59_00020 [Candidatus Competibacteraceae bacterium]|nr:hypothetical protein [Candidatus Competibacteraceae bacterium]